MVIPAATGHSRKPVRFPFSPLAPRTAVLFPLLTLCLLFVLNRATFTNADGALPPSLPTCTDAADISLKDISSIKSLLEPLVSNSTFFSLFSVALDKPCPFWSDENPQCVIRACSVDQCPDEEVPAEWRVPCKTDAPRPVDTLNDVDRRLTGLAALIGEPPCLAVDETAWTARDGASESAFVDLRRNPERFTGFDGPSARRIWEAIYRENCFTFSAKCSSGICAPDTCKEERVLYRLLSGLHASINMHIALAYLMPNKQWAINLSIYRTRVRPFRERVANLRVAQAFVLRAVAKAADRLHPSTFSYATGHTANDAFTKETIGKILDHPIVNPTCEPKTFDESDMFLREDQHLLPEFRKAFRNISMIMDCVGCEKCRLWGKLQFLGLGTAMRILFEREFPPLERNDIIALFNLLYKLSTSVLAVHTMEEQIQMNARLRSKAGVVLGIAILAILSLLAYNSSSKSDTQRETSNTQVVKLKSNTDIKYHTPSKKDVNVRARKRKLGRAD